MRKLCESYERAERHKRPRWRSKLRGQKPTLITQWKTGDRQRLRKQGIDKTKTMQKGKKAHESLFKEKSPSHQKKGRET